jgi:Flp pilus assembly protein TadG
MTRRELYREARRIERWRRMNRGGQAFVEFALVIPLFLFILLGGVQISLALLNLSALNHAARQSAIMLTTGNADLTAILAATAPSNTQVASMTPCSGAGTTARVALTWDASRISFIPLPSFPTALAATGRRYVRANQRVAAGSD